MSIKRVLCDLALENVAIRKSIIRILHLSLKFLDFIFIQLINLKIHLLLAFTLRLMLFALLFDFAFRSWFSFLLHFLTVRGVVTTAHA